MRIARLLAFLILISAATPVAAEDYAPGTIGYLVNSCQKASEAKKPEDYYTSWCAHFQFGFMGGMMAASFFRHHDNSGPQLSKECAKEFWEYFEQQRSGNICSVLWSLQNEDNPFLATFLLTDWGKWLRKNNPALLQKPVMSHIREGVKPGEFCDHLVQSKWHLKKFPLIHDHTPFEGEEDSEFFKMIGYKSEADMHNCMKNEKYISISEKDLKASTCGAMAMGQFAALRLFKIETPEISKNPECLSSMQEMAKHQDPVASLCVPDNIASDQLMSAHNAMVACNK